MSQSVKITHLQNFHSSFTYSLGLVVDELVGVAGSGLRILHLAPILRVVVLVLVEAFPLVLGDAVDPEGVAHPEEVAPLVGLVLVLVEALRIGERKVDKGFIQPPSYYVPS